MSTAVSATFPVLANNPTYYSYDYTFVQNIKCEHIQEDNAVSQKGHNVDDQKIFGLQTVKCEEQRLDSSAQRSSLPFINTDEESTWTCHVNELNGVKPGKKADPDE